MLKPIPGYDGLYSASSDGFIFSHITNKPLKHRINSHGYCQVTLCSGKTKKTFTVHKLVALCFVPNLFSKPQINHIDGCKTNNKPENLEWCTSSENIIHAASTGLAEQSLKNNSINSKPVYQLSIDGEFVRLWPSVNEVERSLGLRHSDIVTCCSGKQKTAFGYKWRYANKEELK